jgi:SAM-dependent methyltransferase
MTVIMDLARMILAKGSERPEEYQVAVRFLEGSKYVIDVACGTGTFLDIGDFNTIGIDFNEENILFCQGKGLKAQLGNALDIPFPDNTFDGSHCSHLLQVFSPNDAVRVISELSRVTKPGGKIVITTLNDFPSFFRHPENVRPYPPDSLRRLFLMQKGAQSPMFPGVPNLIEIGIHLRHPALFEFRFSSSKLLWRVGSVLTACQRIIGLRKWWYFDSYTICFQKPTR